MNLDLDKARAARAEARGDPNTLTFGGKTFTLPGELTLSMAEAMESGNLRLVMKELLNGQAEDFFALDPTVDDLMLLINGDGENVAGLVNIYIPGSSPGESSASSPSLPKGSKKSRQPSNATITSI